MSEKRTKSVVELLNVPGVTGYPPAPKTTREKLIATAINLFYRNGFNSVGIDRIIAETGVTKTTFYKHFEGKDDLILEAVRTRDAWELEAWNRAVKKVAGPKPKAQLIGLFDVLDTWFNDPDFIGCMFINTAAEFPNPNDPVHEAAAEHKISMRNGIRDLAIAADLPEPEAFADRYTVILEGTLILRQVHGRNDAARLAKTMIQALLG